MSLEYRHRDEPGKSRALQSVIDELPDETAVVFFDDDIRADPGVLEAYDRALARWGPGHYFGGGFDVDYEQPPPTWLKPLLPRSAVGWTPRPKELDAFTFLGFNYACWVADLRDAGGFDPNIGPGARSAGTEGSPVGQESDMQRRMAARGAKPICVPEAFVWHYVPADRCTPAWAAQRRYRNAWGIGLTRPAPEDLRAPRLFGAPRYLLRRAWEGRLLRRMARLLRLDDELRCFIDVKTMEWEGYLQGVRDHLRRSREATALPPGEPTPHAGAEARP
jgi:hypothetical protein